MAMYMNVAEALGAAGGLPPWQHPKTVSRKDAGELFKQPGNNVQGAFLIRESAKRPGEFALSVYLNGKPQHFVIKVNPSGRYSIDDGPTYENLSGLVDYYMHDPKSPTRITKPVCRAGAQPDAAAGAPSAPPLRPRGASASRPMITTPQSYENVDKVLANSPPPPAARSPTSASASASPSAEHAGADQMDDFEDDQRHTKKADSKNTKVQKILANQDAVNAMEVAGRDVEIADGAQKANYLAEQFEKEARMTEKLHLFWVNKKMEKMKSDKRISNVTDDLKDGLIIMMLIAELSGKKAPKYNKSPKVPAQIRDNWSCVVKYMKSIGIQVDADGATEDTESVHLDAGLLADMDRREHLKMFSKLMLYENGM
eukprot:m.36553 g.36553  ORF g.36553 m.36553 type:complete len:370 (+) comp12867_c0_seq1:78-1187(+)